MSVDRVPFELSHLDQMEYLEAPGASTRARLAAIQQTPDHHLLTIMRDGVPAVVLAGIILWPGVMDVSALVDERARKEHPATIHRETLAAIDVCQEGRKLHRMQMFVRSDFKIGCRWAERLGFEKEATLKRFGHDKVDSHIYRRLW